MPPTTPPAPPKPTPVPTPKPTAPSVFVHLASFARQAFPITAGVLLMVAIVLAALFYAEMSWQRRTHAPTAKHTTIAKKVATVKPPAAIKKTVVKPAPTQASAPVHPVPAVQMSKNGGGSRINVDVSTSAGTRVVVNVEDGKVTTAATPSAASHRASASAPTPLPPAPAAVPPRAAPAPSSGGFPPVRIPEIQTP